MARRVESKGIERRDNADIAVGAGQGAEEAGSGQDAKGRG